MIEAYLSQPAPGFAIALNVSLVVLVTGFLL